MSVSFKTWLESGKCKGSIWRTLQFSKERIINLRITGRQGLGKCIWNAGKKMRDKFRKRGGPTLQHFSMMQPTAFPIPHLRRVSRPDENVHHDNAYCNYQQIDP